MELEAALPAIKAHGYALAGISYDSQAILREFSVRKHITFPLLSDPSSEIIKRFGILNTTTKPGEMAYGVPFPGIFVLDPSGRVKEKFFEDRYQERETTSSILLQLTGLAGLAGGRMDRGETAAPAGSDSAALRTGQFELTLAASDERVAPGNRLTLVLDFALHDRIHVYAPEVQGGYRPLALSLEPNPLVTIHRPRFPKPEMYLFKPLNERVLVYQRNFLVLQDVTVVVSKETNDLAGSPDPTLTVRGTLGYQACDDRICYNPGTMPVSWTVKLKPLERERSPELLRHKPSLPQ